jgi:hypothetical protein
MLKLIFGHAHDLQADCKPHFVSQVAMSATIVDEHFDARIIAPETHVSQSEVPELQTTKKSIQVYAKQVDGIRLNRQGATRKLTAFMGAVASQQRCFRCDGSNISTRITNAKPEQPASICAKKKKKIAGEHAKCVNICAFTCKFSRLK